MCVCLYRQAHHGRYPPGTGHGVPGEGLVIFRGMPGTGAQAAAERDRHSSAHREVPGQTNSKVKTICQDNRTSSMWFSSFLLLLLMSPSSTVSCIFFIAL